MDLNRPGTKEESATRRSGGATMTTSKHLWAVGYDDMERANHVREEIIRLGWVENRLILEDVAVVVRHLDGSFTINRERFPAASNIVGWSAVGFLAGLVLGMPLVGAAVGAAGGPAGVAHEWARPGGTKRETSQRQAAQPCDCCFTRMVLSMLPGTSASPRIQSRR